MGIEITDCVVEENREKGRSHRMRLLHRTGPVISGSRLEDWCLVVVAAMGGHEPTTKLSKFPVTPLPSVCECGAAPSEGDLS